MEKEKEYISGDIEDVEHYLGELFQVPVGVCIVDTHDIVHDALGYEISDMRRAPDPSTTDSRERVRRAAAKRLRAGATNDLTVDASAAQRG